MSTAPAVTDVHAPASSLRIWDGCGWAEDRGHPAAPPADQHAPLGVALSTYLLAIVVPVIGLALGLAQIRNGRGDVGLLAVSAVVLSAYVALIVLAGA